eukprot:118692-Amphidinium_carterae.2
MASRTQALAWCTKVFVQCDVVRELEGSQSLNKVLHVEQSGASRMHASTCHMYSHLQRTSAVAQVDCARLERKQLHLRNKALTEFRAPKSKRL